MSRRKLSKQQTERVQRRRNVGDMPEAPADHLLGHEQEGLVLSHYGKQADVEDLTDRRIVRCHLRANLGSIVAGDKVIWRSGGDGGVVTALFPRQSELHRPDSFGKLKLVAANVTQMVVVVAPQPEAHANLIDRYLVVGEALELKPLLLLNKADLLSDDHLLPALLAQYASLGYPAVAVSARAGVGIDRKSVV